MPRYTFPVYSQEVDTMQRFRLPALEACLLNAAGYSAAANGFGAMDLMRKGVTWVLSRIAIEMTEFPKQYETMQVETWVEDCGRLVTTRNFAIYNQTNKPIGYASSLWAIMDIETRRPVNLQSQIALSVFANGKSSPIGKPDKIESVENRESFSRQVCYSDIDFNNHTNSSKYLEWMLDAYPIERICRQMIRRFELNYLHEAVCGETVAISWQDMLNTTVFEIRTTDGNALCRAKLYWADC